MDENRTCRRRKRMCSPPEESPEEKEPRRRGGAGIYISASMGQAEQAAREAVRNRTVSGRGGTVFVTGFTAASRRS
jgi:hypothetical protein